MMKTTSPRRSFKMLSSKTSSFQISSKRHFLLPCFRFVDDDFTQKIHHVLWKWWGVNSSNQVRTAPWRKTIFNWQVVVSYFEKKYANLQSVLSSHFLKMKLLQNPPDSGKSPPKFPRFLPNKKAEVREGSTSLGTMTPQKRTGAHHNKVNQGESPLIVVVLQKLEAIPQWTRKYRWYWPGPSQHWRPFYDRSLHPPHRLQKFMDSNSSKGTSSTMTCHPHNPRSFEIYFSPSRSSRQETYKGKIPTKQHHHPAFHTILPPKVPFKAPNTASSTWGFL